MIDDSETVEKYKSATAEYILRKFDWDSVVEKTVALYRK